MMMKSAALLVLVGVLCGPASRAETMLFDFEDADDAGRWTPLKLPEVKQDQPEPGAELSSDHATSGKHSLKITFRGGLWPAVSCDQIAAAGDWKEFQTLRADVTVDRPCIIGFRVMQARSAEPEMIKAFDGRACWDKTATLEPGRNEIAVLLHDRSYPMNPKLGNAVRFAIYAYKPESGQSIYVDRIRVSAEWPEPHNIGYFSPYSCDGFSTAKAKDWESSKALPRFRVAGTDLMVADVIELGKKQQAGWVEPAENTLEQAEGRFKTLCDELRKDHPQALSVLLRDGENGYAGWKDTHISSHGPDGPNDWRTGTFGKKDTLEAFMRHRSVLMKAELTSIPAGSTILAARLLLTRTEKKPTKANMWVAEPCNRSWDEDGANGYEYAPGHFWKAVNGTYYGKDPDFHPVYLAQGGSGWPVCEWDFTEAVRYWMSAEHPNHGFFLHGDSQDYMRIHSREAKESGKRPALLIAYLPPK
jgi:hypothetical protein